MCGPGGVCWGSAHADSDPPPSSPPRAGRAPVCRRGAGGGSRLVAGNGSGSGQHRSYAFSPSNRLVLVKEFSFTNTAAAARRLCPSRSSACQPSSRRWTGAAAALLVREGAAAHGRVQPSRPVCAPPAHRQCGERRARDDRALERPGHPFDELPDGTFGDASFMCTPSPRHGCGLSSWPRRVHLSQRTGDHRRVDVERTATSLETRRNPGGARRPSVRHRQGSGDAA